MVNNRLDIVVEANIPFIRGLLEPYATVRYLQPGDITPEAVRDADALVVRTRTRCDEVLLGGSSVRFVATATIGTDHIDLPWCAAHGITVANAAGCNAPAVAQYVFASILSIKVSDRLGEDASHTQSTLDPATSRIFENSREFSKIFDRSADGLRGLTIGIIGVGHVGSIVERGARQLGMRVLVNDPPRERAEGGAHWSTLDQIAREADIITLHTPLDESTRHLADRQWLSTLQRKPILINAARGPVTDTDALVWAKDQGLVSHLVIDCWEGEPAISPELLACADIATPHIAGYSYEGKARAVRMVLDALCAHFGLPHIDMGENVPLSGRAGDGPPPSPSLTVPDGACDSVTPAAILASYDPMADTAALKAAPWDFEALRNHYALRHEVR